MSGITTGTRLEQLLRLRTRLDHEITTERTRLATQGGINPIPHRPTPQPRPVEPLDLTTPALLAHLGVTGAQVRTWAIDQGLIPAGRPGATPRRIVDAYAAAHPTNPSTTQPSTGEHPA